MFSLHDEFFNCKQFPEPGKATFIFVMSSLSKEFADQARAENISAHVQ